jgi:translation initiation factor IF-3
MSSETAQNLKKFDGDPLYQEVFNKYKKAGVAYTKSGSMPLRDVKFASAMDADSFEQKFGVIIRNMTQGDKISGAHLVWAEADGAYAIRLTTDDGWVPSDETVHCIPEDGPDLGYIESDEELREYQKGVLDIFACMEKAAKRVL